MEVESREIEQAWLHAWRLNPKFRPCTANRLLAQEWLDQNLKVPSAANICAAFAALGPRLAEDIRNAPEVPVAPEPVAPPPETEQEKLHRLERLATWGSEQEKADALREIRGLVKAQRKYGFSK